MIAAPSAKRPRTTSTHPARTELDNERELRRITSILDDQLDEVVPAYRIWPDSMNTLHFTPPSLAGDLSNVARLAFGYNDHNFVRAPVYLPLAYTAQLDDDNLTLVLQHANCAAEALSRVAELYSVRAVVAELAPAALQALAAPPEHDVILHMSARGLEVDYASQPDAAFVVHRPDDPPKLAASIVRNAPPRYAARARALA